MKLRSLSPILLFSLILNGAALAGPPAAAPAGKGAGAVTVAESAWSSTLLGGGVKTNDVYTDGNVFLTIPIWSTIGADGTLGGNYLFIEPYSSVGTGGEVAASLGFSFRHLFSNEPVAALQKKGVAGFMEEGWFVGANFFVDMLDTRHRNSFWQLGVGAEVGNRYVELRGNYYIPLTDRKLAERDVNVQDFQSSSSSTSLSTQQTGGGNAFATGNEIVQQVNSTTFATTTTRTTNTTVRTVTEIFEKGMEGWDAELSLLVPWVDQWVDVKVMGGYFSFDNQPFGPQEYGTGKVQGWKAGIEVRPVPAVVLSGTWYEDKRLTGGDWTVGFGLQVPLDRSWKDSFKLRRRHLVEHLAEPVHRQNDAVKIGNEQEQDVSTTSHTSVKRTTKVVSQTSQKIVLKDDIIFVHNGPTDVGNGIKAHGTTETGTAEQPFDLIQEGATVAQTNSNGSGTTWNVYTQGTAAGYSGNVVTTSGRVDFIGSGALIGTFGTGPAPVVANGGFRASNMGFFGLNGYTVTGGLVGLGLNGVLATDVSDVSIVGNTFNNTVNDSIQLEMDGGGVMNALIDRNTSIGGNSGLFAPISGSGAVLNITVSNYIVQSTDFSGLHLEAASSASINATILNNTVTDAGNVGIRNNNFGSGTVNVVLDGNIVISPNIDAYKAERGGAGALILNSTINNTASGEGALKFSSVGGPTGTIILNGVPVVLPSDVP